MKHRLFWAWLFLFILSVQWIGGVIYVKLQQSAFIDWQMTEAENIVAQKVEQEYGIRTKIRILDEQEQAAILNAGYGAPFIFSNHDEDRTDYFTVETDRKDITQEYLINGPENKQHAGNSLLSLNQLFSPYIINTAAVLKQMDLFRFNSGNFSCQTLADLFHRQTPTPPPSFLA